jgi:hypothetical protein
LASFDSVVETRGCAPGRRALLRRSLRLGRRGRGTLACGRLACGLRWGARVERSERPAEPVGLACELVKALSDLFTQTVDHDFWFLVVGGQAILAAGE